MYYCCLLTKPKNNRQQKKSRNIRFRGLGSVYENKAAFGAPGTSKTALNLLPLYEPSDYFPAIDVHVQDVDATFERGDINWFPAR